MEESPDVSAPGPGGGSFCKEHREKIYFFCEDDGKFLCVFCREGQEHRTHRVDLLDQIAHPYKERLRNRLEGLRKEKEALEGVKQREDAKLHLLLTQLDGKRRQLDAAFERLRGILEGQQRLLRAQLEKLDQAIREEREGYLARISEELARLRVLIVELDLKCQQPASGLLKDIRGTLNRCELGTFVSPEAISADLAEQIREFYRKTLSLPESMEKFSGEQGESVTLDPKTFSGNVVLSADRKSMSFTKVKQDLPDGPERFDQFPGALGCRGFSSGTHTWEAEVGLGPMGACIVGVADEAGKRKGDVSLKPEEGFWALGISSDRCWATTSPSSDLALSDTPKRVRVTLDCDRGQMTLSNAETQAPIFTVPVPGARTLFPFFGVWERGSWLTLSP
uniref:Uncharacterized protein n=1 Tax=Ornithorhynchus anatinus TaxID=9258 RepID=F6W2U9_ORNAN